MDERYTRKDLRVIMLTHIFYRKQPKRKRNAFVLLCCLLKIHTYIEHGSGWGNSSVLPHSTTHKPSIMPSEVPKLKQCLVYCQQKVCSIESNFLVHGQSYTLSSYSPPPLEVHEHIHSKAVCHGFRNKLTRETVIKTNYPYVLNDYKLKCGGNMVVCMAS